MERSHHPEPGRRGRGAGIGVLLATAIGALALAPAAAQAKAPQITQGPTAGGTPQVGATVAALGAKWNGNPTPTVSWQWVRCDNPADSRSCSAIGGATRTTYTITDADLGKRLRVLLVVRNEDGWAWALSPASSAVAAKPEPAPPPSPSPDPSPSPEPDPSPAPVVTPEAPSTPATPSQPGAPFVPPAANEVRDQAAVKPLRMMSPAPLVRIRGRLTRSGARITLLTVKAPRGASIRLRCAGRGCPAERWARTASLTRIARFQAALPAGTRLVISITKPGRIGKHTVIVIRRGKAPTRRDRCLVPGPRRPVACPAT